MPRSAGTYSAPASSWNPAVNGTSATFADWNALLVDMSNALTQSMSLDGQSTPTANLPMGGFKLTGLAAGSATGNSLRWEQLFDQGVEATLASATTTDIGAQNTNFLQVTGTTTITSFGANYKGPRFLRFAGALTLTHNASTLILPGAANIVTAAGDTCIAIPLAAGWYVTQYTRAASLPMPGNGPAFSAYASASQSVSSGVATKVTLDTERFDTANNFASSRFTPTVAGKYQINGVVRCNGTNGSIYFASIYKNGAEYCRGGQLTGSAVVSAAQQMPVSDVVDMNGTTDYIELYGFVVGTSPTFEFIAVGVTSSMSGALIRAS